jgi:membrane-anchored protein YejM (alkaline phosphatase superfamily)
LMHLDPGGVVQVDRSVYEAVRDGELVRKDSWSRQLQVGSDLVDLEWSRDVYGMVVVMPLVFCVLLVTTICVWRTDRQRRVPQTQNVPLPADAGS